MKDLDIEVRWVPVLNAANTPYRYPAPHSRSFLKQNYPQPVVYRWRILPVENDKERVYIGEAEDLCNRIQGVRTPGKSQSTNQQLSKYFAEQLSLNKEVALEIADFEPFSINGVRFSTDDLYSEAKRCFIENLLICLEEAAGHELLNKHERAAFVRIKKLPRSKQIEILEQVLESRKASS